MRLLRLTPSEELRAPELPLREEPLRADPLRDPLLRELPLPERLRLELPPDELRLRELLPDDEPRLREALPDARDLLPDARDLLPDARDLLPELRGLDEPDFDPLREDPEPDRLFDAEEPARPALLRALDAPRDACRPAC